MLLPALLCLTVGKFAVSFVRIGDFKIGATRRTSGGDFDSRLGRSSLAGHERHGRDPALPLPSRRRSAVRRQVVPRQSRVLPLPAGTRAARATFPHRRRQRRCKCPLSIFNCRSFNLISLQKMEVSNGEKLVIRHVGELLLTFRAPTR